MNKHTDVNNCTANSILCMNKEHIYVNNSTALVQFCAMNKKHIHVNNCTDGGDMKFIVQNVQT